MARSDEEDGKWNRSFGIIFSAVVSIVPSALYSIKNIVNLGFDDFVENIPIYVGFAVLMFVFIYAALYLSWKYGPGKRR